MMKTFLPNEIAEFPSCASENIVDAVVWFRCYSGTLVFPEFTCQVYYRICLGPPEGVPRIKNSALRIAKQHTQPRGTDNTITKEIYKDSFPQLENRGRIPTAGKTTSVGNTWRERGRHFPSLFTPHDTIHTPHINVRVTAVPCWKRLIKLGFEKAVSGWLVQTSSQLRMFWPAQAVFWKSW